MISGSYWPGDIYVFYGEGQGKYAKGEILKTKDGSNVNAGKKWESKKKPDMDSLASAPRLHDIDADGDLDLLVGNIAGNLILIENEGDAKNPVFGDKKSRVQAGGKDLNAGNNDSGPTTADWDGDGLWDLIVGSGNGSVTFFKNTGTAKAMKFAAGIELVSKNEKHSIPHSEQPARSYARTKPHVCDWNGDGRLDLLVGDYVGVEMPEPKLTGEQIERRDELRKQRDDLSKQMQKFWELEAKSGELTEEQQKEMEPLQKNYSKVWADLRPLEREHKAAGWVWVYLQKPAAAAN